MTTARLFDISTTIVLGSQVAIGIAGLNWLVRSHWLECAVAISALALTRLPELLVRDQSLRDAVAAVTAVLLTAHIIFGMSMGLYETSSIYDKAMHVLGSAAVASLLMFAVHRYCRRHRIELPQRLIAAIVVGGTLSLGTLWELFEFTIDRTGLFFAQRGLIDTMVDLLADAGGAIILVLGLWITKSMSIRNKNRTTVT